MKKDKGQTKLRLWTGSILAAFLAAVAVFAVMLHMEKEVLEDYERGTIYVTTREIPKGVTITEQNVAEYMKSEEVDVKLIPATALSTPEEVVGLVSGSVLDKGVLLTKGMFQHKNEITGAMEEPVIVGFKAEDLYQVAGGVLRAGDRIHIYTVSETGIAGLIHKNVFVEKVFDSGGNVIVGGDDLSAAQRVNIYLDAAEVEGFYSELARGTLRVVKVCEE